MAEDRVTQPRDGDVRAFVDAVPDPLRRTDTLAAVELVGEVTGAPPRMWGSAMVGFGTRRYTTADGKEREWFAVGLSPRKAALTFYGLLDDDTGAGHDDLLERLGPHSTGKSCLYLPRLDDVDHEVLVALVTRAWGSAGEAG